MAKSSAFVLGAFLALIMVSHFAFAARTMQMGNGPKEIDQNNMVHATRANPTGAKTHVSGAGLTDNKNFVFGGIGSGVGGGVGFVGPFGAVGGFSGIGGGVGAVGFPVGGAVGGVGGVGGGVGGILP